jgi:hypothetical protein
VVDEESGAVLDEAIASLGTTRGLEWVGDAGVEVHLLASALDQSCTRPSSPISSGLQG